MGRVAGAAVPHRLRHAHWSLETEPRAVAAVPHRSCFVHRSLETGPRAGAALPDPPSRPLHPQQDLIDPPLPALLDHPPGPPLLALLEPLLREEIELRSGSASSIAEPLPVVTVKNKAYLVRLNFDIS